MKQKETRCRLHMEQVRIGRDLSALGRFVASDLILPDGRDALRGFLLKRFHEPSPGMVWREQR